MKQTGSMGGALAAFSPIQIFVGGIVGGILVLCTLGFFILLGMVLKGGVGNALAYNGNTGNTAPVVTGDNTQGPINLAPVQNDEHIRGDKNATVTLVEYSDFECPFCGSFHPTMQQVMDKFPGKVRWVYRHYPLSFHPQAQPSAEASECASEQGKFWEFADVMFNNQEKLGDAFYKETAASLKLNMSKFNDCVSTHKYQQKVLDLQATGDQAGVQGTPHTIVVGPNGELVPISGAQPYSAVESIIKQFVN